MKEREYPVTSWQGYVNYVKSHFGRELTEKEIHVLMSTYYIKGVPVDKAVKQMEG